MFKPYDLGIYDDVKLSVIKAMKQKQIDKTLHDNVKEIADRFEKDYNVKVDIEEVIKIIGLDKGHWNKCPNGHYYVIGECGGAMEESKCPDCKAVVGGKDHSLAAGNRHAAELGGASAWDPNGFNARVARGEINLHNIAHD